MAISGYEARDIILISPGTCYCKNKYPNSEIRLTDFWFVDVEELYDHVYCLCLILILSIV